MLRYKMPIQRKSLPGNRNLATSRMSFKGKGWYSKLSPTEQKVLNDPTISVSSEQIPEDSLYGISRSELQSLKQISQYDILNTTMFRDGSMDSVEFQRKVHYYRFVHLCTMKNNGLLSTTLSKNKRTIERNILHKVPTIQFLREQVDMCMDGMNVKRISHSDKSWNFMFHYIVKLCNLQCNFPPWLMPSCYNKQHTCEHTLEVELDKAATDTLYLTALENL